MSIDASALLGKHAVWLRGRKDLEAKRQSQLIKETRLAFRKMALALGCPLEDLPVSRLDMEGPALTELVSKRTGAKPSSARSYSARVRQAIAWGKDTGLLSFPPDSAWKLGYPEVEDLDASAGERSAFRAFLRFTASRDQIADRLDAADLEEFLGVLQANHPNTWRKIWRELARLWQREAERGKLPQIELPTLEDRRSPRYKIGMEELPKNLRAEIRALTERMKGERLAEISSRPRPVRAVTAKHREEALLRFCGFCRLEMGGEALSAAGGLADLVTAERILSYIDFTRRRRRKRADVEASKDGQIEWGEYQLSLLLEFESLVRLDLGREDEANILARQRRRIQSRIVPGREAAKEIPRLNETFQVALALLVKGREENTAGKPVRASLARRDALVFALLGSFGF